MINEDYVVCRDLLMECSENIYYILVLKSKIQANLTSTDNKLSEKEKIHLDKINTFLSNFNEFAKDITEDSVVMINYLLSKSKTYLRDIKEITNHFSVRCSLWEYYSKNLKHCLSEDRLKYSESYDDLNELLVKYSFKDKHDEKNTNRLLYRF